MALRQLSGYLCAHQAEARPELKRPATGGRDRKNTFESLMDVVRDCLPGSMSHALYVDLLSHRPGSLKWRV